MEAASHFEKGTHHCAIFHGNDHGANHRSFKDCKLNPGHDCFITVDEFKKKKFFEKCLVADDIPIVQNNIDRTVRVVAKHISAFRPDTFMSSRKPYPCIEKRGSYSWIRYGTGFLVEHYNLDVDDQCSCPNCQASTSHAPSQVSYFIIKTSTHVIFDKHEAQHAVFEFFYDSPNRSKVKKLYGVSVLGSDVPRLETDMCLVVCGTHDGSLAKKLDRLCVPIQRLVTGALVSHPHGISKRISVGSTFYDSVIIFSDKSSFKLKKGAKIRYPRYRDASYIRETSRFLAEDKPIGDLEDDYRSKTFISLCDMTVHRPEGIVLQTGLCEIFDFKKMWFRLSPGTKLFVEENGQRYTLPQEHEEMCSIMMNELENIDTFSDAMYSYNACKQFRYFGYHVPTCPGSSGAHVPLPLPQSRNDICAGHDLLLECVHFGSSGVLNLNATSLICNKTYIMANTEFHETSSLEERWRGIHKNGGQCQDTLVKTWR